MTAAHAAADRALGAQLLSSLAYQIDAVRAEVSPAAQVDDMIGTMHRPRPP